MKDRIYMVLALLGFVVICIVFVNNYDTTGRDARDFEVGAYYSPTRSQRSESAYEIYQQIAGTRSITCPETSLSSFSGMALNIGTMYGNSTRSLYDCAYWMFPLSISNPDGGFATTDKWAEVLKINKNASSGCAVSSLYTHLEDGIDTFEIIAPFDFDFVNYNTDGTNSIIIRNKRNNCRVTFGNVANWFCAGPVGTTMTVGKNVENTVKTWEEHNGAHQTVIGNTNNAKIQSGSAGQILGYATPSTTVTIEVLQGDKWVTTTFKDFVETTSK